MDTKTRIGFALMLLAVFIFGPYWFATLDCNTAQKGLGAIRRCEQSAHCMLTAKEYRLKQAYLRLEKKSCPKD